MLGDDALEKSIQETLEGCDVQQQLRASFGAAPGDIQLLPSMEVSRKRSILFSKIPLSYFNKIRNMNIIF